MWKWILSIVLFIGLAVFALFIEQPKGSIAGNIILQHGQSAYDTSNIKESDARVIAYGPVTRASYINSNGSFKIDGLPVGEYSLKIRAKGYSSELKWGVNVKEAEETQVKPIKLAYLTPSLWMTSNFSTFTPKDAPYFWFTAYGIDNVKLKLYKFDPEKLITTKSSDQSNYTDFILNESYYNTDNYINNVIKDEKPVKEWDKKVNYGTEDGITVPFKIDEKLPEGAYILLVDGKSNIDNKEYSHPYWFSISKYGLITKQDPTKILVKAVNLETLDPVKDFKINIYDRTQANKYLSSATTNDEGLAEIPYSKKRALEEKELIIFGNKGDSLTLNGSSTWYSPSQDYKVYTYTERPIYRPGQTVYFKGIARKIENNGLKTLANKPVTVTIKNPDYEPIKEIKLRTNNFGSYNGTIELPNEAKLGAYSVYTTIEESENSTYFEIAEYRKPEYKVEVLPGSNIVQGGNEAHATIKATYYFGYPVKNAKVKYTVYSSPDWGLQWKLQPRPDYYAFFDDWDDNSDYNDSTSGNIITEGYAQTDENGEAKISFDTQKVEVSNDKFYSYGDSLPQDYKVEAEVTDISRQSAIGNGHFTVTPGNFALFLDPEYYVYTQNQDIKVKVNSINYNKEFVPKKVTLQLQKWHWDEDNYQYTRPQIIQEKTITTNSKDGTFATLSIPNNATTQDYRIVAISKNDKGNEISTTQYIWISNYFNASKNEKFKPDLQLNLDKKVYKPGDIAKIAIISPVKNVKALVSIEGSKLYQYQTIDITSNTKMIEIPIKEEYMPNAYVSVSLVGPQKQFYEIQKRLLVSPKTNFLNIQLKTDKLTYKPQDTIKYTVKVTDEKGQPVKAEFSMGVVDESIYSIRGDWTEDIRKAFYSERENLVQTAYSFTQNNSAGGDKIKPRVRKEFKDTAFWESDITTNSEGIANVSFKVPDNLTTWRTTVRAVTQNTKVAAATDKFIVTQDIIIRLALPRFYTVGDKAILAAIVHNYTDKVQKIKLQMNFPSNLSVVGFDKSKEKWLSIDPQGQVRNDWHIKAEKAGNAIIQAFALSSSIIGDALEEPIEILPFGVPVSHYISDIVEGDSGTKVINEVIPSKITPGTLSWKLRISPSNASAIFGSLDYLIGYPYGCVEQTMDKFMPAVVVSNLADNLGVSLNQKTKDKFPSVIDDSLTRIYKFQHSDGGWGWWEYDGTKPYMTAYVLYGLTSAETKGVKVKKEVITNGFNWLQEHLNSIETEKISKSSTDKSDHSYMNKSESVSDLCYETYVYSLYGKKNNKILNNLYKNRNYITNEGLAYLSLAFSEYGMSQKASGCVNTILSRVNLSANKLDFSMTKAQLKKLGLDSYYYDFYNDNEVNAIVLRALIKTKQNKSLIYKLANTITLSRKGSYWNNTKTTSNVILAMADYIKYNLEQENPDYNVIIKLNGNEISRLHIDKSNLFNPDYVIEIPNSSINSNNNITLKKIGQGKMYYNSDISYYQLYKSNEIIPAKFSDDVKVSKEFYRLKPTTDKDGNITYKEYRLVGPAKAGEILLVKLAIENKRDKEYLLINDPKASGMETVSRDPRTMDTSEDNSQYYWWDYWWTQEEDRDDHIAFFVTYLPKGKHEFRYLIRPELPGEYLVRPTTVEGMYSAGKIISTASSVIKVDE